MIGEGASSITFERVSKLYGGVAAAPLFQRIASFALSRLHVAPEPPLPIPPHAIKPE